MISNGIKYPLYIKTVSTSSRRGVKNVKLIKEVEKEKYWSKILLGAYSYDIIDVGSIIFFRSNYMDSYINLCQQ